MKQNLFVLLSTLLLVSAQPLHIFAASSSSSETPAPHHPALIKSSPELTPFQNRLLRSCVKYIQPCIVKFSLNIEKTNPALIAFCKNFSEDNLIISVRRTIDIPASLPKVSFIHFFDNQVKPQLEELLLGLATEQEHVIKRQQDEIKNQLISSAKIKRHALRRLQRSPHDTHYMEKSARIESHIEHLQHLQNYNERFIAVLHQEFPPLARASQKASASLRTPQESMKKRCLSYIKKTFPQYKKIIPELKEEVSNLVLQHDIPTTSTARADFFKTVLIPELDLLLIREINKAQQWIIDQVDAPVEQSAETALAQFYLDDATDLISKAQSEGSRTTLIRIQQKHQADLEMYHQKDLETNRVFRNNLNAQFQILRSLLKEVKARVKARTP